MGQSTTSEHVTVLLHEAVDALNLSEDAVVLDATIGGGGHFTMLGNRLSEKGILLGIDADPDALIRVHSVKKESRAQILLHEGNFRDIVSIARNHGIVSVDAVLFDLGWSGYQLNNGKGFSFLEDEPLLMTYGDPTTYPLTAYDLVNEGSPEALKTIIASYGEERHAARIVRALVREREKKPIETSRELGTLIERALGRKGKTHPATKTFQAIRIAVNDELETLSLALEGARSLLKDHGRIAVITFHSLEDRIVKRTFLSWSGRILTKKPIVPSPKELLLNPRARSAKLRIYEHTRTDM